MTTRIHVFALDGRDAARPLCGEFREGDGWTVLPQGVTCPDCRRRVEAQLASRAVQEPAADHHAP